MSRSPHLLRRILTSCSKSKPTTFNMVQRKQSTMSNAPRNNPVLSTDSRASSQLKNIIYKKLGSSRCMQGPSEMLAALSTQLAMAPSTSSAVNEIVPIPRRPESQSGPNPSTPEQTPKVTAEPPKTSLKNFDIQFLIDDSGSMRGSSTSKDKTHWQEVQNVLQKTVDDMLKRQSSAGKGVDVFFLNSILVNQFNGFKIQDPEEVKQLFEGKSKDGIRGSTPTAEALDLIITPYLRECQIKNQKNQAPPLPRKIIVMTDGAANNNELLRENLIQYAKDLDTINAFKFQIQVYFVQVGKLGGVVEFFKYLDNVNKDYGCRDILSVAGLGSEGLTPGRVMKVIGFDQNN